MNALFIVVSTFPSREVARQLGAEVVESGLAACINILGDIESIYPWDGEICRENEVYVMMKTSAATYPKLESWLEENHPYDNPAILALPIEKAAAAYAKWVIENTSQ